MARLFTAASSHYLTVAATPITAVPISMSCWFYPTSVATSATDIMFIRNSSGAAEYWGMYINVTGGKATVATCATLTEKTADSTTSFSANTWNNAVATFSSSTLRTIYLNGGGKATETTNLTPSSTSSITIGGFFDSPTLFGAMDGRLAEIGIWDAVLSDNEAFALAKGATPLRVRPQNLRCYWPLYGNGSPEPSYSRNSTSYNLTLNGSPTQAPHPPVGRLWMSRLSPINVTLDALLGQAVF